MEHFFTFSKRTGELELRGDRFLADEKYAPYRTGTAARQRAGGAGIDFSRQRLYLNHVPPVLRQVTTPRIAYRAPWLDPEQLLTVFDGNAAWLSACRFATLNHEPLQSTGAAGFDRTRPLPGLWEIENFEWDPGKRFGICSPLGADHPDTETVWVATDTLKLLVDLSDDPRGLVPEPRVLDSWTAPNRATIMRWWNLMDQCRDWAWEQAAAGDETYLHAVKLAYSYAIEHIGRGCPAGAQQADGKAWKSRFYRPEWKVVFTAIIQANYWRKAWKIVDAGYDLAMLRGRDEIVMTTAETLYMFDQSDAPLTLDNTGYALGQNKLKKETCLRDEAIHDTPQALMDDEELLAAALAAEGEL